MEGFQKDITAYSNLSIYEEADDIGRSKASQYYSCCFLVFVALVKQSQTEPTSTFSKRLARRLYRYNTTLHYVLYTLVYIYYIADSSSAAAVRSTAVRKEKRSATAEWDGKKGKDMKRRVLTSLWKAVIYGRRHRRRRLYSSRPCCMCVVINMRVLVYIRWSRYSTKQQPVRIRLYLHLEQRTIRRRLCNIIYRLTTGFQRYKLAVALFTVAIVLQYPCNTFRVSLLVLSSTLNRLCCASSARTSLSDLSSSCSAALISSFSLLSNHTYSGCQREKWESRVNVHLTRPDGITCSIGSQSAIATVPCTMQVRSASVAACATATTVGTTVTTTTTISITSEALPMLYENNLKAQPVSCRSILSIRLYKFVHFVCVHLCILIQRTIERNIYIEVVSQPPKLGRARSSKGACRFHQISPFSFLLERQMK